MSDFQWVYWVLINCDSWNLIYTMMYGIMKRKVEVASGTEIFLNHCKEILLETISRNSKYVFYVVSNLERVQEFRVQKSWFSLSVSKFLLKSWKQEISILSNQYILLRFRSEINWTWGLSKDNSENKR